MLPAPDSFIRALIRIARLQGRVVLENVVTGQFRVISEKGGKILTAASQAGKSFAFQVPPSLSTDAIMSKAEEALEYFDSHTEEQVDRLLKGPAKTVRVLF